MSFELNLAIIPNRIYYLEGVQLSFIKIYVHIFNLWHSNKPCFIGVKEFMQRTGLKKTAVYDALNYFEKMGEIKRITKGTKRYIVQPTKSIETEIDDVDNLLESSANNDQVSAIAEKVSVIAENLSANAEHNNKYNNKYNKSFCPTDEKRSKEKEPKKIENEKNHDWAEKKSGFADVTKQTTSYDPDRPPRQAKVSPLLEQYEKSMPARISNLVCKKSLQVNT